MASPSNPDPIRRLSELLEEQQEPFLLDVYLLERGYSKRSIRYRFKKRKAGITKCSKILRSVLTKLVSGKAQKQLDLNPKNVEDGRFIVSCLDSDSRRMTHVAESDRFSSASCTTVFDTCSDLLSSSTDNIRALRLYNLKKAATDKNLQWVMDDSKQLSPVSVLEFEGSPVHSHMEFYSNKEEHKSILFSNLSMGVAEETILSDSLWELIMNSLRQMNGTEVEELKELLGPGSSSPRCFKNKSILQQTKQLLYDCVRETLESTAKEEQRFINVREFLGSEQLCKIIWEQICSWGKEASNLTNMTQLMESDLLNSRKEWSHFQQEINEIGIEIGDEILEEIRDEILSDMIDCCRLKRN